MTNCSRTGTFSRCILISAAALLAAAAFADDSPKPPAEGAFLSTVMKVADNWVLDYLTYEEMIFPAMNGEEHPMKHGMHWRLWGDLDDARKGPNSWSFVKAAVDFAPRKLRTSKRQCAGHTGSRPPSYIHPAPLRALPSDRWKYSCR